MLARLLVQYSHTLPTRHLHAWLRHTVSPDCTDMKLDADGNAVVMAQGHKLKVLSDATTLRALRQGPAKLTVPILYELCTAFDLQDETSDLLCRDLEKTLDTGIGKNYVRWYGSKPRRLAIDFYAQTISSRQCEAGQRRGVTIYRHQTIPHDWIALWGFTKRLRRLLADHLKELLLSQTRLQPFGGI